MTVQNTRLKISFLFFCFWLNQTNAQQQPYNHAFYLHLSENKLETEIEAYLIKFSGINDTATYNLGRLYFSKNNKQSFKKALILDNEYLFNHQSVYKSNAKLYATLTKIILNEESNISAPYVLVQNDSLLSTQIQNLFSAGIKLFSFDTNGVSVLLSNADEYFATQKPREILRKTYTKAANYKPKNKYTAATLSAIVPGLGKVYAGRKLEGLATFMQTGAFGAVLIENIIKSNSMLQVRPIFFGSIFSVFYIGSILGSYQTAKQVNILKKEQIHEEISVALYMLLRNTFRE
ncbi:MAG: hypothetical protein ACK4K9_05400 [Bacteroidia bacterium]